MIAAHATNQASVMSFDDEGDLRLEVGEKTTRRSFIVCSRSLARVSKPFKAMLYGGFAESKSRNPEDPKWTVQLPEDNPEAVITILQIVHSHFGMIPDIVDRDILYQVTILTDKYDMIELLRPWARKWVSNLSSAVTSHQGDEVSSWIAWELGDRSLFENSVQWMLYECHLDGDSKLCCPDGRPLQDNVHIASTDILVEAVAAMLSQVQEALDDLITPEPLVKVGSNTSYHCLHFNTHCEVRKECRTSYFGSLIQALNKKGCYPLPTPQHTREA